MAETSGTAESFILFELAGTTYGVRSRLVQQMEMIETITPVPNAPPFVEGVVFSRGQVVPAINLRQRFGFEKIPHDLRMRLVVVTNGTRSVGLVVDTAREFATIPTEAIQPPPEALSGLSGKYLQGIARLDTRLVLILDLDEVFNYSEITSLAQQTRRLGSEVPNMASRSNSNSFSLVGEIAPLRGETEQLAATTQRSHARRRPGRGGHSKPDSFPR